MKRLTIDAEVRIGQDLKETLSDAQTIATRIGCGIRFKFNGHIFRVYYDSDIEKLYKHFHKITPPKD